MGNLAPKEIHVIVTCRDCGLHFLASPAVDGSMTPIQGRGECGCSAPLDPHYTARQLAQIADLARQSPQSLY